MTQGAVSYDPERFHPERLAAALADPARLDVLHRTGMLDGTPVEAFDRWAGLAARALRCPVAVVSLLDEHRQYVKSVVGLEPSAVAEGGTLATELGVCQYVISGGVPLAVDDTREHPVLDALGRPRDL